MDKIICLVGESGSGKSAIAEILEKEGYNYIQSYTTRPKRYEDERGHIFLDSLPDKDFEIYDNNVIADTYFNGFDYWSTKEQYQGKGNSVYVVDVAGIKELRERITDAEIFVIYLKTDTQTRINRMYERQGFKIIESIPPEVYNKVQDRINHDKQVFKIIPCDYVVDGNGDIKEVLKDVMSIIDIYE